MLVDTKFERVRSVLSEHNSEIGEKNPGYVNVDEFFSHIKVLGGTSSERLRRFSHEEIADCLPTVRIPHMPPAGTKGREVKQTILAKEIAGIFREKSDDDAVTDHKRPVTSKKAERMSLEELVNAYDPTETDSPVAERLIRISKKESFIVYSQGREVDVQTTLTLLKEVKQGYEGRDKITINDILKKVYAIGYLPENYADENPLYPGRPLRPDGTCDQTNRSWEGVDLKLRQLARIAVMRGDVKISIESSHDMFDIIVGIKPLEVFTRRYADAVIAYNELSEEDKLPRLRVILASESKLKGGPHSGPFQSGQKIDWDRARAKKKGKQDRSIEEEEELIVENVLDKSNKFTNPQLLYNKKKSLRETIAHKWRPKLNLKDIREHSMPNLNTSYIEDIQKALIELHEEVGDMKEKNRPKEERRYLGNNLTKEKCEQLSLEDMPEWMGSYSGWSPPIRRGYGDGTLRKDGRDACEKVKKGGTLTTFEMELARAFIDGQNPDQGGKKNSTSPVELYEKYNLTNIRIGDHNE